MFNEDQVIEMARELRLLEKRVIEKFSSQQCGEAFNDDRTSEAEAKAQGDGGNSECPR